MNPPMAPGDESPPERGTPLDDPEAMRAAMRAFLADLEDFRMPFGRYRDRPIHELPLEYLLWFQERDGFPGGKLGRLMKQVCTIKSEGADFVFDPLRRGRRPGGQE